MVNVDPHIIDILAGVHDPEVPVLSVIDLGVVRDVTVNEKTVKVNIIPTYSGCPAMDTIADDIRAAFTQKGYDASVELWLSPAWSTDMISDKGRAALEAYGIAAPLSEGCLLYTSPSPRDATLSRMPSSA